MDAVLKKLLPYFYRYCNDNKIVMQRRRAKDFLLKLPKVLSETQE